MLRGEYGQFKVLGMLRGEYEQGVLMSLGILRGEHGHGVYKVLCILRGECGQGVLRSWVSCRVTMDTVFKALGILGGDYEQGV